MTCTGAELPLQFLSATDTGHEMHSRSLPREADTFFCMIHGRETPRTLVCQTRDERLGEVIDNGPDHHPDDVRFESVCIDCCPHNHA